MIFKLFNLNQRTENREHTQSHMCRHTNEAKTLGRTYVMNVVVVFGVWHIDGSIRQVLYHMGRAEVTH